MASSKSNAGRSGPHLAWHGDDPVAFSIALAALRAADIPTHEISDHDQLVIQPIPGPGYGIFVRKEDAARAEKVIHEAFAKGAAGEGHP